jgi:hypothetical protein
MPNLQELWEWTQAILGSFWNVLLIIVVSVIANEVHLRVRPSFNEQLAKVSSYWAKRAAKRQIMFEGDVTDAGTTQGVILLYQRSNHNMLVVIIVLLYIILTTLGAMNIFGTVAEKQIAWSVAMWISAIPILILRNHFSYLERVYDERLRRLREEMKQFKEVESALLPADK